MNENFLRQPKKNGSHYLIRLINHPTEVCCGNHPRLVEAIGGGSFVEAKCTICGSVYYLTKNDFMEKFRHFVVRCYKCVAKMNPSIISVDKYGFTCKQCKTEVLFVDLLPNFDEINIDGQGKSDIISHNSEAENLSDKVDEGSSTPIETNIDDRSVLLDSQSKRSHYPEITLSQCISCLKFGDVSCAGASSTTGSYDRHSYYCRAYSPDHIKERY